jgi:hypothetical protein
MAEMHLLFLDEEDIALASKILRNVKDIAGIEAAVKRALKECAAKWPGHLFLCKLWNGLMWGLLSLK